MLPCNGRSRDPYMNLVLICFHELSFMRMHNSSYFICILEKKALYFNSDKDLKSVN